MITATSDKELVDRAYLAGATDYVLKPCASEDLVARLRMAERIDDRFFRRKCAMYEDSRQSIASLTAGEDGGPSRSFLKPVHIAQVEGVVKCSVLHNYVSTLLRHSGATLGAIAVYIPALARVHEGASASEYGFVLADIANVLAGELSDAGGFVSYVGGGVFICVGCATRLPQVRRLRVGLIEKLNDPMHVLSAEVPVSFSVVIGGPTGRRLFEPRTDTTFLARAVESLVKVQESRKVCRQRAARSPGRFHIAGNWNGGLTAG